MKQKYELTEAQFLADVAEHQMEVCRDKTHHSDVYRHIKFGKPGSSDMAFELVTWPGYLCYTGDMGTFVFWRTNDMFSFFRRGAADENITINPSYWSQKCEAVDKSDGMTEYSPEKFREAIMGVVNNFIEFAGDSHTEGYYDELRRAVESDVLSEADNGEYKAREAADDFEYDTFRFDEFWEHDLTVYTRRFLWCCHAIVWGIREYDKYHAAKEAA
jgi:hypothetical protein